MDCVSAVPGHAPTFYTRELFREAPEIDKTSSRADLELQFHLLRGRLLAGLFSAISSI